MRKHVAAITALALLTPVPVANAEDLASRFTLGVMPDTQFYARYGTEAAGDIFGDRYGTNPFEVQTEFLAEKHEKLGTQFVTHLGDVVDQPEDRASWDIADRAMQKLEEAGVNYSVLPGNHDPTVVRCAGRIRNSSTPPLGLKPRPVPTSTPWRSRMGTP